jgi:hypothetical protein
LFAEEFQENLEPKVEEFQENLEPKVEGFCKTLKLAEEFEKGLSFVKVY